MKFPKYVMLAGAAALLTACSSEEPAKGGQQNEGGEGMYFAINLVGGQTRDGETATPRKGENDLNRLQIFILDQDENLYFEKTVELDNINNNNQALFEVTNVTYNEMLNRLESETPMKIMVYANGTGSLSSAEDLLHGTTSNPTWGTSDADNMGFVMSNAAEVLGVLKAPAEDAKGTKEHPWVIAEDIELARLATRFEYSADNKTMAALHDQGLQMSVAGFDVVTFATSTFRLPQFSANGKMPETPDATNHCHFAPTGAFKYRVTESFGSDEYKKYNQYTYNLTSGNKYCYERPNTVSTDFTKFNEVGESFKKVPFAAVKAEFNCTNFAGSGKPSESMKSGKDVYAISGIFIGGFEDFKMLRADGVKEFKVNYKDGATVKFTEADKSVIDQIEKNYNRLLEMTLPSEYEGSTATEADDLKWFLQNIGEGYDVYHAQGGKYYTYYAHLIVNDKDSNDNYWKYGVSRNTSYALSVTTFKFLGNSGDGFPGTGPQKADLSDMALQFSVKVKDWTPNFNNKWDL